MEEILNSIPLVSVACITYNQEGYIKDAIEGFLMQKTTFPIEIIINDDASTDDTARIVRNYADKHPTLIIPILQTENQHSLGINPGYKFVLPKCQGKYIAVCEGDDYWTDPFKLQKQVDFLEANENYSICFHPVNVVFEDKSQDEYIFPTSEFLFNKTTLTTDDLVQHNFIQTNSVLYRSVFNRQVRIEKLPSGILPGDWYLHLLHSKYGRIGFIPDVMSVYRRHDDGIWQNEAAFNYAFEHRKFYKEVDLLYDHKYSDKINTNITDLYNQIIEISYYKQDFSKLEILLEKYPEDKKAVLELVFQLIGCRNDQRRQLNQITNSKSYKLGRFLLGPLKLLKSKLV